MSTNAFFSALQLLEDEALFGPGFKVRMESKEHSGTGFETVSIYCDGVLVNSVTQSYKLTDEGDILQQSKRLAQARAQYTMLSYLLSDSVRKMREMAKELNGNKQRS